MSDADLILTERDAGSGLVVVTLNRPEKLNAFTKPMWRRLGEEIATLSADEAVRCIVLRGAGTRAFSPGNDISEFSTDRSNSVQAAAYGTLMERTLGALRDCPHPLVAMIHGVCVGGGLEVACLCDVRICGTNSRFGAPINRLGLTMGYAEMQSVVDLVGRAVALEILLEGRIFDAAEALQKGLVSRVVDVAEVEAEALSAAQRIAAGAPLVARWHKKFARRLGDPRPLSDSERAEAYACYDTEDFRIGYKAFLDKTDPVFKGR